MSDSKRILVVEDDPNLGYVIQDNLQLKGYSVTLCNEGESGFRCFSQQPFDLCIFDVMLPKKDGFTLAREVRERNPNIPILFLTAKSMMDDKLEGFAAGADDYITKPFSLEELFCRIEVFMSRCERKINQQEKSIQLGAYQFDPASFVLRIHGAEKMLTARESELLAMLARHQEKVLKREEILTAIWGNDDYFLGRSLDVFISKLRKYLKEDPTIQIVNYHGVGFKLQVSVSEKM